MNYFNYYTEIEDTFIRRRGKHLLLSPLDWALIESWKQTGVPLHVALRGIERAFDSHESRPRKRSVKSLFYCQEEVEAQFDEWRESQLGASGVEANGDSAAGNGTPGAGAHGASAPDANESNLPFPREAIMSHLAECRASLGRASEASPPGELRESLGRAARRLEELAGDFARAARPDAERLESALADLEQLLDRALRSSLAAAELDAARARAEEQLKPYRARMERATYEQTLDNLLAKILREGRGLPRLSLFYL
ncbi:MAG TPA: hypothetical protein VER08_03260 [Pyrinomonadaceae bacterium]|nr:hypothetical protein [Pyrinomonadaceae bacterium]